MENKIKAQVKEFLIGLIKTIQCEGFQDGDGMGSLMNSTFEWPNELERNCPDEIDFTEIVEAEMTRLNKLTTEYYLTPQYDAEYGDHEIMVESKQCWMSEEVSAPEGISHSPFHLTEDEEAML